MLDASSAAPAARSPWIVGPRYDLGWFFGGVVISLLVLGLSLGAGVPIVVLWWIWLLAFDGPHIAAAFTRTYVDREEWRKRRGVLVLSLFTLAVGPAFLGLNLLTGSKQPFLLFLGLAAFYGYYHIVRQHYGFLALYKARSRDFGRLDLHLDKWFLYVGCWAPYFWFIFTHPRARVLIGLSAGEPTGPLERAVPVALLVLWFLAFAAFLARLAVRFRERIRRPHGAYLLLTVLLYGGVYFLVARLEPLYAASTGPDQDFLLLSILVTVFHNVQYLGLVWFHNRNRYRSRDHGFGLASTLNRSFPRFLYACVLFSLAIYFLSACSTGVFPRCQILLDAKLGPFTANEVGLAFWWGLAVNHYYLDQKIWRIRGDDELKRNLGLS